MDMMNFSSQQARKEGSYHAFFPFNPAKLYAFPGCFFVRKLASGVLQYSF